MMVDLVLARENNQLLINSLFKGRETDGTHLVLVAGLLVLPHLLEEFSDFSTAELATSIDLSAILSLSVEVIELSSSLLSANGALTQALVLTQLLSLLERGKLIRYHLYYRLFFFLFLLLLLLLHRRLHSSVNILSSVNSRAEISSVSIEEINHIELHDVEFDGVLAAALTQVDAVDECLLLLFVVSECSKTLNQHIPTHVQLSSALIEVALEIWISPSKAITIRISCTVHSREESQQTYNAAQDSLRNHLVVLLEPGDSFIEDFDRCLTEYELDHNSFLAEPFFSSNERSRIRLEYIVEVDQEHCLELAAPHHILRDVIIIPDFLPSSVRVEHVEHLAHYISG